MCGSLGTLLIAQDAIGQPQVTGILQSILGNEAFFRGTQELILEDGGEDCGVYRNAMIVTLSQFCLATGQRDPSMVPLEQLKELARSVTDDINVT